MTPRVNTNVKHGLGVIILQAGSMREFLFLKMSW